MRIIAFFLAFIVIALSCLPCADGTYDAIHTGKATAISKSTTREQTKGHNDACSPFCQCACCAGFAVNHVFAIFTILPVIYKKQFASYLPANLFEISLPIWQPPQLVS